MQGLAVADIAALVAAAALAQPSACPSPFLLDPKPLITLPQLMRLGRPALYRRDPQASEAFVVQLFDSEAYPVSKGRQGVAVIYASNGDEDEPALGGLLWSKVTADLDKARMKALDRANGDVNLVFTTREPFGGKACGRASFLLRIHSGTDDVFVNGSKVGSLNDPG